MKNRIRWGLILLPVLLLVLLMGCRDQGGSADDAPYRVYRVNLDGTALLDVAYRGETQDPDRAVSGMLEQMASSQEALEGQPAIPGGVELLDFTLEDEKLSLYFNGAYWRMDTVQEVLCRAALVRSLTQLDFVDLVAIYVEGNPLTNDEGEAYGFMQADDFVKNTGSSINSYETVEFTLYFSNMTGDALVRQKKSVRYNTSISREQAIVEQLINGAAGNSYQTVPANMNLLGVSLRDGICYLNFDDGFLNAVKGVRPEIVIYSIVNSVTEGGTAGSVQISVNGDSNIMYQGSVDLSMPLRRDLDIVEDD